VAKNLKEEIERYRRLYEQGVLNDAFISYAEALREAKNLTMALNICREGLASNPDSLPARLLLSRILLDMGHYHRAQAEVEKVLKKAPDSFFALLILARILMRKREYAGSKRIIERLEKTVPSHPELNKLKSELSQYLHTVETTSPGAGQKSTLSDSPSERAKVLVDLFRRDKEIRDFYIVSRDKSSASDNFPLSILSATESFGNLCAKFKDILNQELETIVIESNDGTLFITTLRSILLVILCTTKARIGKIKMLIQRILLGESTKNTKDKDENQK